MFKKPFKVKNNCQLKSTEKKKLCASILQTFPLLTRDTLKSFASKECINQMKIMTHQGEMVSVYISDGRPMIITLSDEIMLPTLYFLWIHPTITKYFTVSKFVLDKISKGADLMVPGIITNEGDKDVVFEKVHKGAPIAINTLENHAAQAVGISLMNTTLLKNSEGRGKAVNVIHSYGDFLFKSSTEKIEMPCLSLMDIEDNSNEGIDSVSHEEVGTVASEVDAVTQVLENLSNNDDKEELSKVEDNTSSTIQEIPPDEILRSAFLRGIYLSRNQNKITLPILTNIFYKNYILSSVPPGVNFDIKKTSYKKLSLFLNEMEKEGVIVLSTSKSNVQSITDINYRHILVSKFDNSSYEQDISQTSTEIRKSNVEIIENYVVSSNNSLLFSKYGYQKGDIIPLDVIKKNLRTYIDSEQLLRNVNNQTVIIMDPILANITGFKQDTVPFSNVILKILENMGNYYVIKRDGEITKEGRGKVPSIDIAVKIRTNNKKVTLINNLDIFGINMNDLSRECQHSLAASATINKCSNNKNELQLQIQGSHIKYIKRLLKDKYGIPEKYIIDK